MMSQTRDETRRDWPETGATNQSAEMDPTQELRSLAITLDPTPWAKIRFHFIESRNNTLYV